MGQRWNLIIYLELFKPWWILLPCYIVHYVILQCYVFISFTLSLSLSIAGTGKDCWKKRVKIRHKIALSTDNKCFSICGTLKFWKIWDVGKASFFSPILLYFEAQFSAEIYVTWKDIKDRVYKLDLEV